MDEVSEFERQRQANIERNRKLLASLNLNSLSNEISESIKQEDEASKRKKSSSTTQKKTKRQKVEVQPIRRSRRLAGVSIDDSDSKAREFELEEDRRRREREELEKLKTLRVDGDLSLLDLVKDQTVKSEDGEDSSKLLEKFQKFLGNSKSFSIGDYFETIVKKDNSSKDVKKLREELGSKELYTHFKPNDIKLTKDRMTYICFHPDIDRKLIIGGDSTGNLGIWNSENTDDVDILSFKLHGKNIAKLEFNMNDTTKVYSASYDGSIRSIDLRSMKSSQLFINDFDVGITDINYNNDNEMYYTTMQGQFSRIDLRAGDHSRRQVLRLSNKKIGGFTINPMNKNQIATASLDRTLKVWDLRTATTCDWDEWDDNLETLHTVGVYDSRLSVSIVDWNRSGDLVCNGYDDTVNIFNLGEDISTKPKNFAIEGDLTPSHRIKHNCQTGRWVSILKARWQQYTPDKEKFVIANMNKYFDVYDRDGHQLAHLSNPLVTNVPAVCNFHPTQNWLVGGGASGKVYMFS
ncbi:Cmr1p [Cyberlindnera jadinii NRRL Y-1542]|uniref:DNA damage-binding protein CMR1 n=1 Tax=Cyberlindnera jadinii (strain ATCC 18201 / CBS 1600 / BCRC 20928 / JCM 3617 / NBRC 0987 / NRRL Y-1542) TaxID=983966 RepID=A0A1E4S2M4_CYBJN|nr:WD40 repeat-like protein [Cyberlindnera jadinii NRRL Y-1542]ODV73758.1 WD40 repeat-like protein [Cyberlindnera jadinii NRRL Y-1542]